MNARNHDPQRKEMTMTRNANSPRTGRLLALHAAAQEGDISAVNCRIQRGQRTDVRKNGRLPIELAAANGHTKVCVALLDSLESNDRDYFAAVAARFAAAKGHTETCGALLHAISDNGQWRRAIGRALEATVLQRQEATLMVLLDGLDCEERRRLANELLSLAARSGLANTCALLLDCAPDGTVERKRIMATALDEAIARGHGKASAALLAHVPVGAWRTRLVNDALFWAVEREQNEISSLLLEEGADMDAPRHDGESPRSWVAKSPQLRAVFEGHLLRSRQGAGAERSRAAM
jgi:ankyrin repeat protein